MANFTPASAGIAAMGLYLPDQAYSIGEYLSSRPTDFTVDTMKSIWTANFFEPEFEHRFFNDAAKWCPALSAPSELESEGFIAATGLDRVYCASEETAAEMAVNAARQVLDLRPEAASQIGVLIYYHSTLNQRLVSCTPGFLLQSLGLKNAFGFSVENKNGNSCIIAAKLACDMLAAEPDLKSVLLVGSDKLVPPYSRFFGNMTVMGDSASAMLIERECGRQILDFDAVDYAEWWDPYNYSEQQVRQFPAFIEHKASAFLDAQRRRLEMQWSDFSLIILPNLNRSFARNVCARAGIPWEKCYSKNIRKYGCLMASDPVANLSSAIDDGDLKEGDLCLILGLGLGASLGSLLLKA